MAEWLKLFWFRTIAMKNRKNCDTVYYLFVPHECSQLQKNAQSIESFLSLSSTSYFVFVFHSILCVCVYVFDSFHNHSHCFDPDADNSKLLIQ